MDFFYLYFSGFVLGGFGAWFFMKYGGQIGHNDIPSHRSSHTRTIPKGGGAGIVGALILASLTLSIPPGFWLAAAIIAAASLWGGDKELLSPVQRLMIQFLCSFIFLWNLNMGSGFFVLLSVPLAIFIVGTANFYNFMDGIDGIAGITGVVGFSLLAVYSYHDGVNEPYGVLCIVLGVSCLGFLGFNLPRARVFLGDIGSVTLGFVFGCLIVGLSDNLTDFVVLAGFLAPFYLDEIVTMAIRIYHGDSLIQPHRKHVYQLLANELSIPHWKIALSYGGVQWGIGLTMICLKDSSSLFGLLLLYVMYSLIFVLVSIKIHKKVAAK